MGGLFNSAVLDLAIGVIFVYLLMAIICTTINEWLAGLLGARAKTLAKAIGQLLDNQKTPTGEFLTEFYSHPLITGMKSSASTDTSKDQPSYLSGRTFAMTVMDLAAKGANNTQKIGPITLSQLEEGAKALAPGDVGKALLALLQNANGDLQVAQKNIENWFDDAMERASGGYKRKTQIVTVIVAAVLTIATNADTLRIGELLWKNPTLRSSLVEQAKARTETAKEASEVETRAEYPENDPLNPVIKPVTRDELSALKPLLGWQDVEVSDGKAWLSRMLGWFLSITAISMGAPFWFDLLKRVMSIRNAGQKPEKSEDSPPGGRRGEMMLAAEGRNDPTPKIHPSSLCHLAYRIHA